MKAFGGRPATTHAHPAPFAVSFPRCGACRPPPSWPCCCCCCSLPAAGGANPGAPADRRLHVLLINGGGAPADNFRSHVLHLEELTELLDQAGVPQERIAVLASDGSDPRPDVARRGQDPDGFWLLDGTGLQRWLEEPLRYENTALPGRALAPATRGSVRQWFGKARGRLRPGDTLLLYVTDHGKDDPRDPRRNHITLWGPGQSLDVRQLAAELLRLPRGVRVVTLMSQCFSGGFAHLLDVRARRRLPSGAACGYFASTEDRPAFGCYPEASRSDRSGHSFAMFDALKATGSLPAAHAEALVLDRTPDVPLRTSDAFLSELLRRAAHADDLEEHDLAERLLAASRRLPAIEELALVDRVAAAFGLPRPRTLADLDDAREELAASRRRLDTHREMWETALAEMTRSNYQRLLAASPRLATRVKPAALRRLRGEARRALTRELIAALSEVADGSPSDRHRLDTLMKNTEAATAATYRMDVREAVLLRMRTLLISAAGRAYLASRGRPDERSAFAAVKSCEDLGPARPRSARRPARPARGLPPDGGRRRAHPRAAAVLAGHRLPAGGRRHPGPPRPRGWGGPGHRGPARLTGPAGWPGPRRHRARGSRTPLRAPGPDPELDHVVAARPPAGPRRPPPGQPPGRARDPHRSAVALTAAGAARANAPAPGSAEDDHEDRRGGQAEHRHGDHDPEEGAAVHGTIRTARRRPLQQPARGSGRYQGPPARTGRTGNRPGRGSRARPASSGARAGAA